MTTEEIQTAEQEISISIEQARELVNRSERLDRLNRNEDFQKLFISGYARDEAARLVGLLMDPEGQSEREMIQRDLDGISSFRQYAINIRRIGRMMSARIARSEEELENVREAQLEEEE